jgi:hypothetical protein
MLQNKEATMIGETKDTYTIFMGKHLENHPFARLRRWEDGISIDLKEIGYEAWILCGSGRGSLFG